MNLSSIRDNLTLQQLRYFVAVAESGSYSTGGRIKRTQPAISRGIHELERLLSKKLFRDDDRTVLTPFGRDVLASARHVLGAVESLARKSVAAADDVLRGPLSLGTKLGLAETDLPKILRKLRKKHPSLSIQVRSKDGRTLLAMLERGDVEIVFSHERERGPDIEFVPLFRHKRIIIAPKDHRIMKRRALSATAIAAEPIIVPERGGSTARAVFDRLRAYGPNGRLNIPIEVMSADARRRYVMEGWGIAIAEEGHEIFLEKELTSRPIPESILPCRTVGVYRVVGRDLSPAAEEFMRVAKELLL